MKEGSHGFQGNRGGEKQSLLTEYKGGGGGYKTLTANEGDH